MSYYPKRKTYSRANTYAKKYASQTRKKPSAYNIKRATYTKGQVKPTGELKQWFFVAQSPQNQCTSGNFAQGIPWTNAPNLNNGVFTQGNNQGILALCHAIGQGSAANQRIGNKITATRLDVSIVMRHFNTLNAANFAAILQMWIVVDTQWSGAANINLTDLTFPATGENLGVPILNNASRFKILKKVILNPTTLGTGSQDATNANTLYQMAYNKTINLKKLDIKFRAATAGQNTPADVQNNQIFVAFSVSPNSLADVTFCGSITYYDA